MAILKFRCSRCEYTREGLYKRPVAVTCPRCSSPMKLVPSIPGYRRDHTVKEVDE